MISGTSQYFSLVHMTTIGYTRAEFSLMLKEIKALLRGKLVLTRPSRKVKSNKVYSGLWQKFHVFVSPSPLNLHGNIMWLVFCVHLKSKHCLDPLTADKNVFKCLLIVCCCGPVQCFHKRGNVEMDLGFCCMGSLFSILVPDDKFMINCNNSSLACLFVNRVLFLVLKKYLNRYMYLYIFD